MSIRSYFRVASVSGEILPFKLCNSIVRRSWDYVYSLSFVYRFPPLGSRYLRDAKFTVLFLRSVRPSLICTQIRGADLSNYTGISGIRVNVMRLHVCYEIEYQTLG